MNIRGVMFNLALKVSVSLKKSRKDYCHVMLTWQWNEC